MQLILETPSSTAPTSDFKSLSTTIGKRSKLYAWLDDHGRCLAPTFYEVLIASGLETVESLQECIKSVKDIEFLFINSNGMPETVLMQRLMDSIENERARKAIVTTEQQTSASPAAKVPQVLARYSMLHADDSLLHDVELAEAAALAASAANTTSVSSNESDDEWFSAENDEIVTGKDDRLIKSESSSVAPQRTEGFIKNPSLLKMMENCKLINNMWISAAVSIESFANTTSERLANGSLQELLPISKKHNTKRTFSEFMYSNITKTKPQCRSGRWTKEEEEYIAVLIEEFEAGTLPLSNGTMLRMFLSTVLNCERMRVSKKFAGRGPRKTATESMGQHVFCRNQNMINWMSDEELECRRNRLVYHELAFYNKIYQLQIQPQLKDNDILSSGVSNVPMPLYMGWHTFCPKTNPIISYFGAFRSANGGRKAGTLRLTNPEDDYNMTL